MEINKEMYGAYVKQITPTHNKWINLLWAFVTGGMICAAGQLLFNTFLSWGMEKEEAAAWELLSLIAVSGAEHISEDRKIRRSRGIGPDHRLCQFRSRPCHGV